MIEDDLITQLKLNDTISSMVGDRIYYRTVKKGNTRYPYIVWDRVSGVSSYTHDGSRLLTCSWQFVPWARDAVTSSELAEVIERALNLFSNNRFLRVFLENHIDRYEEATDLYSVIVQLGGIVKE